MCLEADVAWAVIAVCDAAKVRVSSDPFEFPARSSKDRFQGGG